MSRGLAIVAGGLTALLMACTGNATPMASTAQPTAAATTVATSTPTVVSTPTVTATASATATATSTPTPVATPTAAVATPTAQAPVATPTQVPVAAQAPPPPPPPAAANVALEIKGFAFTAATVKRGTTVTWTNHDTVQHDVTVNDPEFKFQSPALNEGESFTRTFDRPGTISYMCSIHPFMTGTLIVQ